MRFGTIVSHGFAGVVIASVFALVGADLWRGYQRTFPAEEAATGIDPETRVAMIRAEQRAAAGPGEVTNFVLFHDVPFGRDGFEKVTTGSRYETARDPEPVFTWCYIGRPIGGGPVNESLTLAVRERGATVTETALDKALAKAFGTSLEVLREARALCRFPGAPAVPGTDGALAARPAVHS